MKCCLDVSLDLTPAFKGYTLEDSKHRVSQVIEVSHTIIWILISFWANVTVRARRLSFLDEHLAAEKVLRMNSSSLNIQASVLQDTSKELLPKDTKDHKEERKYHQCIFKQGESREYGNNDNL